MVQMVKNLPTMQETRVLSLGQEDPLGKGIDTHSSILAWRITWTEKPGWLQPMGLQRVIQLSDQEHTHTHGMYRFVLRWMIAYFLTWCLDHNLFHN